MSNRSRSASDADDVRGDRRNRQRWSEREATRGLEIEACRCNRGERVAARVTPTAEVGPDHVHDTLEACESGRVGPNVLEKPQLATGTDHPAQLRQGRPLVLARDTLADTRGIVDEVAPSPGTAPPPPPADAGQGLVAVFSGALGLERLRHAGVQAGENRMVHLRRLRLGHQRSPTPTSRT